MSNKTAPQKYFRVKVDAELIDLPVSLQKKIAIILTNEKERAYKDGYESGKRQAEKEHEIVKNSVRPVGNYNPVTPVTLPLEFAAKIVKGFERYSDWEQNSILNAVIFQVKQQRERVAQGALTEKEKVNDEQSAFYADRVLALNKLKDIFKELLG